MLASSLLVGRTSVWRVSPAGNPEERNRGEVPGSLCNNLLSWWPVQSKRARTYSVKKLPSLWKPLGFSTLLYWSQTWHKFGGNKPHENCGTRFKILQPTTIIFTGRQCEPKQHCLKDLKSCHYLVFSFGSISAITCFIWNGSFERSGTFLKNFCSLFIMKFA